MGDLNPFHALGILFFSGGDKDYFQSVLRILESLFGFFVVFVLFCSL